MRKLNVHVLFEHGSDRKPFGIAYIRDLLPLTHPSNRQAFNVSSATHYAPADIVIVERSWKPSINLEEAENLVECVRRDGARLVYSIDDNLLDLEQIPLQVRMVIRYFCRSADAVLVSTAYLRRRLSVLNPHIYLLPNAIDERLFLQNGQRRPPNRQPSGRLVIGYMGTLTHDADLMMILQALRTVLRRNSDRVELQFVGGLSGHTVLRALDGLPIRTLRVPVQDVAYPNFIPWMQKHAQWDLGLAPLEDTYFTRSKSDIKFLDYSALGIAGIYSRVPSYTGTIEHLNTGYLAENRPDAWIEGLQTLIDNTDLRLRLAQSAQDYVFAKRTLEQCAPHWREALLEIAARP